MKMMCTVTLGVLLAAPAALSAAEDQVERGRAVFTAQKCSVCHSIAGKGSKKGPLDDVGSRLTPAEIREWIVDPVGMTAKAKPTPTRKPAMKKKVMPAEDVDALVALLTTLKKG
jgi:mono/diheme cytochrome c family protein